MDNMEFKIPLLTVPYMQFKGVLFIECFLFRLAKHYA